MRDVHNDISIGIVWKVATGKAVMDGNEIQKVCFVAYNEGDCQL